MADVMVIDCMSAQFGGGKERPKTILAGDLGRATIKQMLIYQYVVSGQVEECYFDDFFEDAPNL